MTPFETGRSAALEESLKTGTAETSTSAAIFPAAIPQKASKTRLFKQRAVLFKGHNVGNAEFAGLCRNDKGQGDANRRKDHIHGGVFVKSL